MGDTSAAMEEPVCGSNARLAPEVSTGEKGASGTGGTRGKGWMEDNVIYMVNSLPIKYRQAGQFL